MYRYEMAREPPMRWAPRQRMAQEKPGVDLHEEPGPRPRPSPSSPAPAGPGASEKKDLIIKY